MVKWSDPWDGARASGSNREKVRRGTAASIRLSALALLVCLLLASMSFGAQRVRCVTSITGAPRPEDLGAVGGVFFDDEKGRLYVTDAESKQILAFDSTFQFLSAFPPSEGDGGVLTWPTSLVRDSQDRFFVAQPIVGNVVRIDVAKREIEVVELDSVPGENPVYPCNLAIGPFDGLYIVDGANERILVFDVNQRFVREIKVHGAQGLKDVKVDSSGRVYAVSTMDGSVHIFDVKGRRISGFGTRGRDEGACRFPVSLAVDRNGLIYVLDQHMGKVLVFNRLGEFLFDFKRLGWKEGELHYPSYIFVNRAGQIFVVDRQNSRINVFE